MITHWRDGFKRAFWPLVWLAGLAMVIGYAPPGYRRLELADGEHVIDFRGPSHELITVSGRPRREETKPVKAGAPGLQLPQLRMPKVLGRSTARVHAVALGNAVHLWNLDRDTRRDLSLGRSLEIFGVTPSADGTRIFIEYRLEHYHPEPFSFSTDTGCRIVVFDPETGRSLFRTVKSSCPCALEGISDDGKTLAYSSTAITTTCLHIDADRELHGLSGTDQSFSPDGKHVAGNRFNAYTATFDAVLCDLERQRRVELPGKSSFFFGFSPRSDKLILLDNQSMRADIWDIAAERVIQQVPFGSIFVNDGQEVAWLESGNDGLAVKFREIETQRDMPGRTIRIHDRPGMIEAVDRRGYLVRLDGSKWPGELTPVQKVLDWLGFKQKAPDEGPHHWVVFDARSGQVLDRGRDELIAVSSDGRYIVSGNRDQTELKLHVLPLHRSMTFMAAAGPGWTVLVVIGRRWWRRRLKPLIQDEESLRDEG